MAESLAAAAVVAVVPGAAGVVAAGYHTMPQQFPCDCPHGSPGLQQCPDLPLSPASAGPRQPLEPRGGRLGAAEGPGAGSVTSGAGLDPGVGAEGSAGAGERNTSLNCNIV